MSDVKPRLRPVRVPWAISPSVPYLRVQESGGGLPQFATFIAHFPYQPPDQEAAGSEARLRIVNDPGVFVPANDAEAARFRLVRVNFEGGSRYRTLPAFSDSEVVREADYDWSLVPGLRPGEAIDRYLRRLREDWNRSGISPDPRMYEVERSKWVAESGLSPGIRHLLLLGHDEFVEVLATAWSWEPGQAVE